jgi:hypothetical protein
MKSTNEKYVAIDKQQCEINDIPMFHWHNIYQAIDTINCQLGIIETHEKALINWLKNDLSYHVKTENLNLINDVNKTLGEILSKNKILELNHIKRKISFYLPVESLK